jgi:hypothetical protein
MDQFGSASPVPGFPPLPDWLAPRKNRAEPLPMQRESTLSAEQFAQIEANNKGFLTADFCTEDQFTPKSLELRLYYWQDSAHDEAGESAGFVWKLSCAVIVSPAGAYLPEVGYFDWKGFEDTVKDESERACERNEEQDAAEDREDARYWDAA